ncbi:sigma-70 family RNA polymerase sigma factor [Oceanobacillus chungangensis]|uniref:RNA polymerase subunit sigma-24 n=1 Tax=Oceanobacillus chungangensis TaxID=1229152 RepID=A0A3D8PTB5_9BACI|nr:sigma-70 family RNA polymerase sigma factor [Oceanobacillus chungangensis]RDW19356.1 RNA polymerase subunit sigma-24 [Oceanobacillus chungangensis]
MRIVKEVKKAQKGNVTSFEKLIAAHNVIMYRVAKTILSRDEDCADAIQESILKAFQNIRTLREPAYFKTWLCRIIINECNQIHRQRKNLVSMEDWVEPSSEESGYYQIEMEDLLNALPVEQAQLLKMFHIEDISIHDLALIFEVPENTVKTRLLRAREKMRDLLLKKEEGFRWTDGKEN